MWEMWLTTGGEVRGNAIGDNSEIVWEWVGGGGWVKEWGNGGGFGCCCCCFGRG